MYDRYYILRGVTYGFHSCGFGGRRSTVGKAQKTFCNAAYGNSFGLTIDLLMQYPV